jgi:phosphohistidine phosphatase
VLLSSPFTRAWQTAELLAELTPWLAPDPFPALEPNVPPHEIAAALKPYTGATSIALVGHRPSIHQLASYLLTGTGEGLDFGLKKGGAAHLRFDGAPEPGGGELCWLLALKLLRLKR